MQLISMRNLDISRDRQTQHPAFAQHANEQAENTSRITHDLCLSCAETIRNQRFSLSYKLRQRIQNNTTNI